MQATIHFTSGEFVAIKRDEFVGLLEAWQKYLETGEQTLIICHEPMNNRPIYIALSTITYAEPI